MILRPIPKILPKKRANWLGRSAGMSIDIPCQSDRGTRPFCAALQQVTSLPQSTEVSKSLTRILEPMASLNSQSGGLPYTESVWVCLKCTWPHDFMLLISHLFSPLEMQPKTLPFSPWHYKVQGFWSPSGCFMFLGFFDTLAFFPFRQQIHSSSSTTFLYSYCFSMKTWESRMLCNEEIFLCFRNFCRLWHRITFKLSPDGWAVFRKQLSYFCDVIDVCTTFALFQDSQGRWNACESVLNTLTRPQGSHVANWVV